MTLLNVLILNISCVFVIFLVYLTIRLQFLKANLCGDGNKKLKKQVPFKVDKFIDNLGTINNIITVEHSQKKIKIFVKDVNLVKIKNLQRMKHRGIIKQSNSITIVLGDYVVALAQLLENYLMAKK